MDELLESMTLEDIFASYRRRDGEGSRRSIGVTADPPNFLDHYIQVIAPLAIDLSHLPSMFGGARIVIVQEDRPAPRLAETRRDGGTS